MGKPGPDRKTILEMIETHRLTAEEGYRLLKESNRGEGTEMPCRAVLLTKPGTVEDLEIVPFHPQDPAESEVQIRVRAFSLNFADYLCLMGMYPNMPEYPFTPGVEVAGIVVKTGRKVQRVRVGDEVIALMGPGMGGHSHVVNTDERAVVPKPGNVSFAEACAFPAAFLTMYHIFEKALLEKGEKILIQTAAGSTGLIAVQMALLKEAEIFATAGSPGKLDYLKKMGVHHPIDYRSHDFARQVMDITGNYGVDVVINTLSGDAIQKGIDLLAPGGRYMEIAVAGLKSAPPLDLSHMVSNQTFYSFDLEKFAKKYPQKVSAYLDKMVEFLEKGLVKPTVAKVFPFSQTRQAYRYLEDRKNLGKVVVTPGPTTPEIAPEPLKISAPAPKETRPAETGIAIIGMSGRFPGAKDLRQFWQNLAAGKCAITEAPPGRWDISTYYDPDRKKVDKTDCKWGGFLDDIDTFDPLFFHLSGKEAELTDPQQRLLLEESWKALEDAGYANPAISAKRCGVFAGAAVGDYLKNKDERLSLQAYSWLGNTTSITPARISYFLNLKGPAVALDTACSSALVAVHLARQSILAGDCDMALAGGVFIGTTPGFHILASNAGMLSPVGKCKVFDDEADGFVPGEGVGVVVLKPLAAALLDKDQIYAVIKGSCINQDGKTNGITAPSTLSQTELELALYEKFNLHPETITYVETHGTATRLGDPIEIQALTGAFNRYTRKKQYCAVGSVKSNIGHAATAAGIAGLIKVILSLQHKQIPPSLHYKTPNRHINFAGSPFYVNTALQDWNPVDMPRRAAVSAFGFSGTNAHLVLEEAPDPGKPSSTAYRPPYYFIPLSAKTETALAQRHKDLLAWLEPGKDENPGDLAYTLLAGRSHFSIRSALIAANLDELRSKLEALLQQDPPGNFAVSGEDPEENLTRQGKQLTEELGAAGTLTPEEYKAKVEALASLYIKGCDPDWPALYKDQGVKRISLPTYPFDIDKERYWAPDATVTAAPPGSRTAPHILIDSWETLKGKWRFKKVFSGKEFFIHDHGHMLPGVVYMEMVRAAGHLVEPHGQVKKLKNLTWPNPIMIETGTKEIVAALYQSREPGVWEFHVSTGDSGIDAPPVIHSRGMLQYEIEPGNSSATEELIDVEAVLKRCRGGKSAADDYFCKITASGGSLGPRFRGIQEFYFNENEAISRVDILPEQEEDLHRYGLQPTLTDAAFQSMAAFGLVTVFKPHQVYLPYVLGELEIIDTASRVAYVYVQPSGRRWENQPERQKFDALLLDKNGRILLKMKEFLLRPITRAAAAGSENKPGTTELLFCKSRWEESPLETIGPGSPNLFGTGAERSGTILVFDTRPTLIQGLEERLSHQGEKERHRFILVKPGEQYRLLDDRVYEVNPEVGEDYERLALSLKERGLLPGKILHAWSPGDFPAGTNPLKAQLQRGLYSLFHITRAFMKQTREKTVQLLYFFPGGPDNPRPPYAAVSGFTRCISLESRKISFKVIEIAQAAVPSSPLADPTTPTAPIPMDIVLAELAAETPEDLEIRYEGRLRRARRLREFDLESEAVPGPGGRGLAIKENNTYLITGGLGRLGMIFARHLASQAKVNLVLTDCSPVTAEQETRLRELASLGAAVVYIEADLARHQEVAALAAGVKSKFGGISGILHCAGLNRDALLLNKTLAEMEHVLGPKVYGTVYLDDLFREESLEFFLLFSSTTAILGYPGQGDYGFANGFMDSFAPWRERLRKQGKRFGKTLSLNWSSWEEGGMKMDKNAEEMCFNTLGIKPLDTPSGLRVFALGLLYPGPGFMVLAGNREKIRRALNLGSIDDLAGETQPAAHSPGSQPHEAGESKAGAERFQKDLLTIVSALLKIPASKITLTQNMSHYGFDSISFTELSHQLNAEYRLGLTPDIFFEHSTLESLSTYLWDTYRDRLESFYLENSESFTTPPPPQHSNKKVLRGPGAGVRRTHPIRGFPAAEDVFDKFTCTCNLHLPPLAEKSPWPPEANEPVAIIGMSGVMPQAENLEVFLAHLKSGTNLITEIPPDRWDWREFYGDPRTQPGKTDIKWGGFMKEVDKFDPLFFGITPFEAEFMDPQVRIFLQIAWETIEDAGYSAAALSGTDTGVFVGATNTDWVKLLEHQSIEVLQLIFMISGRVSYVLNLRGPSETMDTACSSSLAAVHRAVAAVRRGECGMAIAGGINLMVDPTTHILVSKNDSLSGQGRCFTFDKRANGYARGEGAGAILLKPLSRAEADGDHIYALIRGTAVNHCGHTGSPTTPNPVAQADVIIAAMEKAGIDPATIGYIETHGTGTSLGDPIEINGLKRAFRHLYGEWGRPVPAQPVCGLGTVKTYAGHLEPAAGIAGIIHVLLAMKQKTLYGNINFRELNPYIKLEDSPFYLVTNTQPWPEIKDEQGRVLPRRAGVSSFGIGGTNVHVVLEAYENPVQAVQASGEETAGTKAYVVTLSAKDQERLKEYAHRLIRFLETRAHQPGEDIDEAELRQRVQADLVNMAAVVLSVSAADISPREELEECGFDPVKLAALLELLDDTFHLEINLHRFLGPRSPESLARHLLTEHREALIRYYNQDPGREAGTREESGYKVNLADLAYTLQVGRDPMPERLALVVTGIGPLLEKLNRYVHSAGNADIENLYRGNAKSGAGKSPLQETGTEADTVIQGLMEECNLHRLAQLWVSGVEIHWSRLYAGLAQPPKRVSLPTYPFARERYWAPALPQARGAAAVNTPPREPGVRAERPGPDSPDNLKSGAVDYLKGVLSALIKLDKNRIDPAAGFEEIGMDSLMVNRLNTILKEQFEGLPATLFFTYKNLASLAGYFAENHGETLKRVLASSTGVGQGVKDVELSLRRPGALLKNRPWTPQNFLLAEDDIAIIGISGQYPMAANLEEFWENLKASRNCVTEIPLERWDYRRFFDPRQGKKGGMYCYWGGFLEDVDKFDPLFFNISPLEARFMDPQERLFLQTAWSCCENAGYTRKMLGNPNLADHRGAVGVFVGITFNNYQLLAAADFAKGNMIPINSQLFSVANRISYLFNFSGPSMPVDTACSSSLYAVHLACESIKRRECDLAIAGGVNLSLHPSKYTTLCQGQAGSSIGHCDAFGQGSDGYVPAEAVGALLLKPLGKAEQDGDHIHALIKSTAVNHDGHTYGYSVPNPLAQAELIKMALDKAGLSPETISYVEAHGTGTILGDPIEIQGLTQAYRHYTAKTGYCSIGSVKSNIGHAEAAAGIAQITKVVLQMKHKLLVPSLIHSQHTNPNIDFTKTPFTVLRETREWQQPVLGEKGKTTTYPRRAGISSFGVGGVNVHVILEEYCRQPANPTAAQADNGNTHPVALILSAKGAENLHRCARNLEDFLEKHSGASGNGTNLADIAYTLQVGREAMPFRLALLARTPGEALEKLRQFLNLDTQTPGRFLPGETRKVNPAEQGELAAAWAAGKTVDWQELYVDKDQRPRPRRVPLPTYPFSKERYWLTETAGMTAPGIPAARETAPPGPGAKSPGEAGILETLAAAPGSERYPLIGSYLQKTVAELLEFPPHNLPDLDRGFFDMGIDSIMSTLLYTRIEQDLKVELYATATIDYPNAAQLARFLLEQIPFEQAAPPGPTVTAGVEPATYEKIYLRHEWEREDPDLEPPVTTTTTTTAAAAAPPRHLLVFAAGTEIVSLLEEKQIRPVLVQPGKSFQQVRERLYRVNPDNPGDFQRLLDALVTHKQMPDHILYAWYGKPFSAGEQALRQQLRLGIYSLFHLSKALLEQRPANTVRLLAVYPGNRETPQPQHEAVRAFGRSIAMENPKLVYRTAALDSLAQEPGQAVDLLLREFRAGDEPGLAVCWEGNQRWVKRFREYSPREIRAAQTPRPPLFKENGVYIITGGAGGVGLIFARHIAQTVNAAIVLTGRSDLTPSKEQQLENLRQLGSRVVYLKADVGDRAQVEKLAAETRQRFKTIDGIIHSAGVLRDSFLIKKTGREIEDVFSPKVYGTIHLDEVTRDDNLDFFILFSSMVAIFGNAGQCDYAYANHFIDSWAALREQLRAQNRRKGKTTAINWTNWKQGGMQVDEKLLKVLDHRYGIVPIEDREGVMAFETALRLNRPCVGFIAAERSKLHRLMKILPPQETSPRQPIELLTPGDEPLRDDIQRMTPLEVETEMESLLSALKL